MEKLRVLSIFGTRPCAIKMAPVLIELGKNKNKINSFIAVTGQHREMLDQVLDLFELKPDFNLGIMKPEQTLSYITQSILRKMEKVFAEVSPDLVLVHGDTPTAFVGALASFYHKIPTGHVESGLRTYDKFNPFPEEINRQLIDRVSDLYFAPTLLTRDNLLRENVPSKKIFVTGNTVIDALYSVTKKDHEFDSPELGKIDFKTQRAILLTMHRREALGRKMDKVFEAIKEISDKFPDLEIIFPVHLNPKVQSSAQKILGKKPQVHLLSPLSYKDLSQLLKRVYLVMTDSGGLQEEAPALGKPVLVLRDKTERPEGVEEGTLKLVGLDKEKIIKKTVVLLQDKEEYERMSKATNPYGDGKASVRVVKAILYNFGLSKERPRDFQI